MNWLLRLGAVLLAASALAGPAGAAGGPERIVFVRHGEKPKAGLGQLNCKGLNRAIALPGYIAKNFGRPAAIFAPDPSRKKTDGGVAYNYIRPLATIEPTAVAFGLPIQAHIGFDDVAGLRKALEAPQYRGQLVVVAWEHRLIDAVVSDLLKTHGADASLVPAWDDGDYDSVDIVTIDNSGRASFERTREGLDGMSEDCPH